ncbi:MAG TPA: DUF3179 domain-containing (seleno)protein [Vicinamibacterales bacterium]|nr:DUF3179 domain-containing (seleno)protein [Vicinamibacterales bacterium]
MTIDLKQRVRCLLCACAVATIAVPGFAQTQTGPPGMLPYVAIDHPDFVPAASASFLLDDDVLIGVARGGVARAYPAGDLAQHGSVNDEMPDGPIEVTWCGVCNTGAVFRSAIKGQRLHFDYDSMVGANEVHRDRETGTRWQQSTGEAISGPLKGSHLDLYPFVRTTWKEWRRRYPNTVVLKPLPGYADRMPTVSARIKTERLGDGAAPKGAFGHDDRLRPRELVAGLQVGHASAAYPFSELRAVRVVNDRVGSVPVLVVHQPSSDTTTAFDARVKGKALRFEVKDPDANLLMDLDTHSTWDAYGLCISGRQKGTQLKPLALVPEFWFAWSEFHPGTSVFTAAHTPTAAVEWETLIRAPLEAGIDPVISVFSLSPRATKGTLGAGHRHPGPVFGYILRGEVENQVLPDPPAVYTTGQVFFEAPRHLHIVMRNTSETAPATVLAFLAGMRTGANAAAKPVVEADFPSADGQEVVLRRLTLAAGKSVAAPAVATPSLVAVVAGQVDVTDRDGRASDHAPGDAFVRPAHARLVFRNTGRTPAQVVFYEVHRSS